MKIKRTCIARQEFDINFLVGDAHEKTDWDEDKAVKVLENKGIAVENILGMCQQGANIDIFYKSN